MKLISMTDFVLEQKQSETIIENRFITEELITLEKIRNYTNFLKQPLALGMFVPCDENGNVLQQPKSFYEKDLSNEEITFLRELDSQYQQAKEKVLFKGFERFNEYCAIHSKHKAVYIDDEYCQSHIIEDLINHEDLFSLTESALKQIGLWEK